MLIGYGLETVKDATEPQFSDNMAYLGDAFVRMLKGNSANPPAALDTASRVLRYYSYFARLVVFLARQPTKAGTILFLFLGIILIGGLIWIWGYGVGHQVPLAQYATWAGYGVIAALSLVAAGTVLGWRWGFVSWAGVFLLGIIVEAFLCPPGLERMLPWLKWPL